MANEYYTVTADFAPRTKAKGEEVKAEYDALVVGFDKLPTEAELKTNTANYAVDTGAANAYVVTLGTTPTLADGLEVVFKAANASTGASTLNVNALGAKAILHSDGTALIADSIVAGAMVQVRYNGTSFIMESQSKGYMEKVTAANVALTNADVVSTNNNVALTNADVVTTNADVALTNADVVLAEAAKVAAELAYDNFDDRWLGDKAADPTLDNNGAALLTGAAYFNTVINKIKLYDGNAWAAIQDGLTAMVYEITRPSITSPASGATNTDIGITLVGSAYSTADTFTGTQDYSEMRIATDSGFTTIVFQDTTLTATGLLPETLYYAQIRYGSDNHVSDWSSTVSFTTRSAGITDPTITSPANLATDIGKNVDVTTSAYSTFGHAEAHASTDWQVASDAGFTTIVSQSLADAVNLTSWTSGDLVESTTYYVRAKYHSATYSSGWSTAISFTTAAQFNDVIGVAGTEGFAVGYSINDLTSIGLVELTGTTDSTHANYGNYSHTETGSIMVCVPKFFYRVGNAASPNFATYGANALDIVGTDTYATEALANAGGYSMPRAFWDGGVEKDEVFIDKYINSKFDATKPKSVFGAHPISLTTNAGYEPSSTMTGCTGILADAVVLGRARGSGYSNMSTFAWGMLSILQVAHAQSSTAATHCAWYDGTDTTNFPKGCNSALADVNDASVTYTTAGATDANKPLTGATANFNKTTHNGQANGIADLNGSMWESTIGITNFGATATATTAITNDNIYVLKPSVALTSLTGGWDGVNDVWGNTTHMGTLYDAATSPHALGSVTGTVYWGSGANGVFATDERWCGFIPKDNASTDAATGTNQFGNDRAYRYNRENMVALCGGAWGWATLAGLFSRYFSRYRSYAGVTDGFRCLAYLP